MSIVLTAEDVEVYCSYEHKEDAVEGYVCTSPDWYPCYGYPYLTVANVLTALTERVAELDDA